MSGTIRVNGEIKAHAATTVAELLRSLGLEASRAGVAVAVNGRVVPRSRWSEQALSAGDDVDIVRPAQGG